METTYFYFTSQFFITSASHLNLHCTRRTTWWWEKGSVLLLRYILMIYTKKNHINKMNIRMWFMEVKYHLKP